MTILGSLDGIEAGLRQMRRTRPLATCAVDVGPGLAVTAPTAEEALRIKSYLVVQRNQVRDYLDVVALAEHLGRERAVEILSHIDDYYDDRSGTQGSVRISRWHSWASVVDECGELALRLAGGAR